MWRPALFHLLAIFSTRADRHLSDLVACRRFRRHAQRQLVHAGLDLRHWERGHLVSTQRHKPDPRWF